MAQTSKNSKPYTFILQKVIKPPNLSCTRLLFESEIILIFSGIFLHRLSRILKINIKWMRVKKDYFSRQKCIIRRDNTKSDKPSWKARNNPHKFHTKNRIFVYCIIPVKVQPYGINVK